MKKEELIKLVEKEAKTLKKKATKKERSRLNFDSLNPSTKGGCIYGQMTGHCFSPRANTLIKKSCSKVLHGPLSNYSDCGTSSRKVRLQDVGRGYWSPIEVFITSMENRSNGNNKMLVRYLKGKRKTLKFKEF